MLLAPRLPVSLQTHLVLDVARTSPREGSSCARAGVRAGWERLNGNASSLTTWFLKYLSLKYLTGIGLNSYFGRKWGKISDGLLSSEILRE